MATEVQIKPYNTKELANLYGVSRETIKKWLSKMPDIKRTGHFFNINQVKAIFTHLGTPTHE